MDSLPVQKLSSSNCHWPVSRVNQVVHVLAVLIGQGVFTAPAAENQNESKKRFKNPPQCLQSKNERVPKSDIIWSDYLKRQKQLHEPKPTQQKALKLLTAG